MLQLVRHSSFVTKPWKNGGGITKEALRKGIPGAAPDAERFLWRVSVAHVDTSGPFSDFAGYRRSMVLLQGDGVRLSFSDRSVTELRQVGDLVTFDGALAADCQLLGGPCVDFNLMVAAEVTVLEANVESLDMPLRVDTSDATTLLIFCIEGALDVAEADGRSVQLERWDVAEVTPTAAAPQGAGQSGTAPGFGVQLAPRTGAAGTRFFIAKLVD